MLLLTRVSELLCFKQKLAIYISTNFVLKVGARRYEYQKLDNGCACVQLGVVLPVEIVSNKVPQYCLFELTYFGWALDLIFVKSSIFGNSSDFSFFSPENSKIRKMGWVGGWKNRGKHEMFIILSIHLTLKLKGYRSSPYLFYWSRINRKCRRKEKKKTFH